VTASSASDVLDALSDLVAKSLVVTEPTDDGTTRCSLLETLRQYARERLDETGVVVMRPTTPTTASSSHLRSSPPTRSRRERGSSSISTTCAPL
jgi:predicted ATPase